VAKFKADMHNLYIWGCKDPTRKWVKLLLIETDDMIFAMMKSWHPEWCTPDLAEMEKIAGQQ